MRHVRPEKKISILVPFQSRDPYRNQVWEWLHQYLHAHLPEAEIIVGRDVLADQIIEEAVPFSKTVAVNNAFRQSIGDVIVILDADAYLDTRVIQHCAERLRAARRIGKHTWYVPYSHIFRLTQEATMHVLESDPAHPLRFTTPPPRIDTESTDGSGWGHRFGALCMIMPREAFALIGGMDSRFRGWGGEDSSFLRALDTLWGVHGLTPNDILHMWHPFYSASKWIDPRGGFYTLRMWEDQKEGRANDWLSSQYAKATNKPAEMRRIVSEGHAILRYDNEEVV